MRIALVSHAYPRWDGDLAGAFVARLAHGLARRGHAVTAVVPADAGQGGDSDEGGVSVLRYRYGPAVIERLAHRGTMVREAATPWGAFAFFRLVHRAREYLELLRPDVVHAHWWIPSGWSAALATRGGVPAPVITMHGSDVRLAERVPGAGRFARRILRTAVSLTVVSRDLAARVGSVAGILPQDIAVIPMPADLEHFPTEPAPERSGIVTVARLVPQKRVDLLLKAVARLKARGQAVPVTVVGDGPARRRLERLAADLGIDATFVGAVTPSGVPRHLRTAAAAVFPARAEGFGLAAAEALMCGVPIVVAEDGGGLLDAADTEDAARIAAPRPDAIADCLADLLATPAATTHAWEAGRAWRKRLDADAVAARFEELYRNAT